MKQLLGHARPSTTDRYMRELSGPKREAMEKIENLIFFPRKRAAENGICDSDVAYRSVGREGNLLKRLVDLEGFEPSTS